jgi:CrcB protein
METVTRIAFIAAGGAAGAVARYLLNISPLQRVFTSFPTPTFTINVLGSFLIGFFLILLTDRIDIGDNLRFAVMVGFLGAFTTFSTFELEIWGLLRENNYVAAFLYLFLSIALGFFGLLAGIFLARKL